MVALVSRKGKIVHLSTNGYMDIADQTPMRLDTIFRIYSMTKAITSVALMTLFEQGKFQIDAAAYHWIPEIKTLRVYREGGKLEELEHDITIRHLLTHTAGFSYGFEPHTHPIDKLYKQVWRTIDSEKTLSDLMESTLQLPLIAQPGNLWHYSIATDICGYLVELMSDMPFGDYLKQNIIDPLEMVDTAFEVPPEKLERFATLYGWTEKDALAVLETSMSSPFIPPAKMKSVAMQSGGGGLVSTASDYWRFSQMMLNGGELDNVRIIGRKTVDWMTMNQIPSKLLPIAYNGIVPEPSMAYGFSFGYCVNIDPANAGTLGSRGDYGWGGMADTHCWVDPKEALIGILMQQYSPSLTYASYQDFRNAVYQALL